MPNLKMNLKFDIEVTILLFPCLSVVGCWHSYSYLFRIYSNPCVIQVLFKNLGVDMKDVTPTSLLKDRKREIEGNPDFSNKDVGASQTQMISDIKPGLVPPVNQVELPLEVTNPSNTGAHPHMLSQVCLPYILWGFGYLFSF